MDLKLTFKGFDGHVTMNVAKNIERLEMLDQIGINVMDLAGNKKAAENAFKKPEVVIKLLKASIKHYKEVNLTRGHKTYKTFDELDEDMDCQKVQMDCATASLLGIGGNTGKK